MSDHGSSPNGEDVVLGTSQVVVGTRQEGVGAVGCQPIRQGEKKRGRRGRPNSMP